jgi:flavin reductase (DIM6/NTAB) family NADH-FMN oxidoreductase RutF
MSTSFSESPVEPADFRRVLGHFPTGVTIVTAAVGNTPVGVAIGSFVSISLDPPLVGFFLGNESTSAPGLQEAGSFCVNVLAHDQLELCGTMASKAGDKFSGWQWSPSPGSGSPMFAGIHAYIDCALVETITVGDHDLYVGRVLALDTVESIDPMVFYQGRYGTFGSAG